MKRLPFIFACLLLITQPATAWTRLGHATVANIAEANLTPAAQAQVKVLLQGDLDRYGKLSGRSTLASVSIWADEIRMVAPEKTYIGWHTRGNPVCSPKIGPCWFFGACVDKKLAHYFKVLKNVQAPHRERNEALKWVVHLVGDLHTPLHSGSNHDGAGNISARLAGQTGPYNSLHSIWDRDLPNLALVGQLPIKATLPPSTVLSPDAIRQWMLETRDVSKKHVYDPLPGFQCGADASVPHELDRIYIEQALPVIRQQIERAGLRLALMLNEALK